MKNFTLLFITIFLLGGCSSKDENENWFDSKEEAIKHGLKMEGVQDTNVLEEINIDGEAFLVFFNAASEDYVNLGIANIAYENKKYSWFRSKAFTKVNTSKNENAIEISWKVESKSGKKYTAYAGTLITDDAMKIQTEEGFITPIINKKLGIYYYLN